MTIERNITFEEVIKEWTVNKLNEVVKCNIKKINKILGDSSKNNKCILYEESGAYKIICAQWPVILVKQKTFEIIWNPQKEHVSEPLKIWKITVCLISDKETSKQWYINFDNQKIISWVHEKIIKDSFRKNLLWKLQYKVIENWKEVWYSFKKYKKI